MKCCLCGQGLDLCACAMADFHHGIRVSTNMFFSLELMIPIHAYIIFPFSRLLPLCFFCVLCLLRVLFVFVCSFSWPIWLLVVFTSCSFFPCSLTSICNKRLAKQQTVRHRQVNANENVYLFLCYILLMITNFFILYECKKKLLLYALFFHAYLLLMLVSTRNFYTQFIFAAVIHVNLYTWPEIRCLITSHITLWSKNPYGTNPSTPTEYNQKYGL